MLNVVLVVLGSLFGFAASTFTYWRLIKSACYELALDRQEDIGQLDLPIEIVPCDNCRGCGRARTNLLGSEYVRCVKCSGEGQLKIRVESLKDGSEEAYLDKVKTIHREMLLFNKEVVDGLVKTEARIADMDEVVIPEIQEMFSDRLDSLERQLDVIRKRSVRF